MFNIIKLYRLYKMSNKQIILPLELLEKCINQRILIIMKDEKEFIGDLIGYDQNYSKNNF